MMVFRARVVWALLAGLFLLAGCAGGGSSTDRASRTSSRSDTSAVNQPIPAAVANSILGSSGVSGNINNLGSYPVGPYDVISVLVLNVPNLSGDYPVGENGDIAFPLIGSVRVAGMTTDQISAELAKRLSKDYLQSPQVAVSVKEYKSQRVTVEGAVEKPGVFEINGQTTLLQGVAMASGVSRYGEAENVIIFRQQNGQKMAARFDLGQIRSGQSEDPRLLAGDVVVVPESKAKTGARDIVQFLPLATAFALIL